MRVIVFLLLVFISGTCFADDPLETLNTVEDTVTTMQHALRSRPAPEAEAPVLYFVSTSDIAASDWVAATPCPGGAAQTGDPAQICLPEGGSGNGCRLWKSTAATLSELRPGMMVLAQDAEKNGAWVAAKVTDLSEVGSGYVGITAPFKAQLKGLRVVVE
jgi:hypothetical protein